MADGRHREPLVDTPEGAIASCLTIGIMARAEGFVHNGAAYRDDASVAQNPPDNRPQQGLQCQAFADRSMVVTHP